MSLATEENLKESELATLIEKVMSLLKEKRFHESLTLVQKILLDAPDHVEALYLQAVNQRYLEQHDDALASLTRLRTHDDRHARSYQEEGHNLRSSNPPKAIRAYESAVSLNPTLLASWQALQILYKQLGNSQALAETTKQYLAWSKVSPELRAANSFFIEGKLYKAEQLCCVHLQKQPRDVAGMRLLANIGLEQNIYDDAEFLLESCLEFEPDFDEARFDYVSVLHKRQKYQKALEQITILRKKNDSSLSYKMAFAAQNVALGNFDTALEVYDSLLEDTQSNSDASVHLMRGHALKTIGQLDKAIDAYRSATVHEQGFGDAYWSLANLKTYRFTSEEIDQMVVRESQDSVNQVDRIHLCFALGKAYEDAEQYEKSFDFYQRGNALKKQQLGYSADRIEAEVTSQIEVCTADFFKSKLGFGNTANDPIFIVGLPRAGSTLLEQILASHSLVDGTLELPNVLALAHRLNGRRRANEEARYPRILSDLNLEQATEFGEAFIRDTQVYRGDAPYFIDKMPNNFRHIGLIHLMLPNAKIIDARRHPIACCFSGYKQLFAEGQEFSYSMTDIARYYKDYARLMDHWDAVLPGKILKVQYENVVSDLESEVHRILDFCGLPFEPACLDFHKTKRAVRTASSEQVRQPIYQQGVTLWKNYESKLTNMKSELGNLISND